MKPDTYSDQEMGLSRRIAKELWRLRSDRGLTLEQLSEAIEQQYGCFISAESLKNYESWKSRSGTNLGMKLLNLYYLADFYGISVDSLLYGESSFPYSDKAYQTLKLLSKTPLKDTVERLLRNASMFRNLIKPIDVAARSVSEMLHRVWDDPEPDIIAIEARHLKRDTAEDIERALEPICGFRSLDNAIKTKKKSNKEGEEYGNSETEG